MRGDEHTNPHDPKALTQARSLAKWQTKTQVLVLTEREERTATAADSSKASVRDRSNGGSYQLAQFCSTDSIG